MSTGQSILTIAAFVLLSTMLLTFYSVVSGTSDNLQSGQDGILATSIATSYMELAQGKAFDDVSDTSDAAILNPSALTDYNKLGPEPADTSVALYNDFDDFNGLTLRKFVTPWPDTSKSFTTTFHVLYVNANNPEIPVYGRTFVKRMDLKTWRDKPPASHPGEIDTLRSSLVMGYFHFD